MLHRLQRDLYSRRPSRGKGNPNRSLLALVCIALVLHSVSVGIVLVAPSVLLPPYWTTWTFVNYGPWSCCLEMACSDKVGGRTVLNLRRALKALGEGPMPI